MPGSPGLGIIIGGSGVPGSTGGSGSPGISGVVPASSLAVTELS